MAKFTLSIDCGNAAFDEEPGPELGRILAELARAIADDWDITRRVTSGANLRDFNGNTVGRWAYDA